LDYSNANSGELIFMGLIRFYLAISVAVWHISDTSLMINGYLAVICFYIISGYYMSMVLNGSYRGPGSTIRFYVARYLRLYPTYLVIAALSIAASKAASTSSTMSSGCSSPTETRTKPSPMPSSARCAGVRR
jgi:peptidoglycan/LPS O-acetylase OafA/YrhL